MRQPGITAFGTMADGRQVQRITLSSEMLSVSLLTLGAIVQSVRFDQVAHDLTLGSDHLADYEGPMRYHGSLIGPVANRIGSASARIGGRICHFDANQGDDITLHSGSAGTHLKLWDLVELTETYALLHLSLADGEGGFPGNRRLACRFSVKGPALWMEVTATTDAPGLMNIANHSYWNLDGSADWSGHRLTIFADHYLPCTDAFLPTGEIRPAAGTPFDFRQPRRIAAGHPPLDNNFCLAPARRDLTPVLRLEGESGVTMTVATTEPGIQVYDGRQAIRPGHTAFEGLAIEAQFWPDATNHPAFPEISIFPGQDWRQITEWRFGRG